MNELTEWTWNRAREAGVLPDKWLDLTMADLRKANLPGADLTRVNLTGADLTWADLRKANLTGADLDFSAWPLWCGSLGVKCDARLARQLMYHACALDCDDPEYLAVRDACLEFANKIHRDDVPRLKTKERNST